MSPGPTLIPHARLQVMVGSVPKTVTAAEAFAGRSVALFGVLGAFTPSCHHVHLPEILQDFDAFAANGIDLVACTAVNDVYVLDAWAKSLGAADRILFLADGNGEFAGELGLLFDARSLGLGYRSKHYLMWVKDGAIQHLSIDPDPTASEISTAYAMLTLFERWSTAEAAASGRAYA